MSKAQHKVQGIGKEFARYAIPAVVGMVVSSLYNIVDGIFVGRGVGEAGLGAINIVYPFIMLEIAITMLIAIGGANHFSASRGRGDNKTANNIFLQCMVLIIGIGIVLNLLVLIFTPAVCRILGADDVLLPYAQEYIWWIALFGIIYMPGLVLSIFVRNDNAPRRELVGTLCGTVVNMVPRGRPARAMQSQRPRHRSIWIRTAKSWKNAHSLTSIHSASATSSRAGRITM